MGRELAVGPVVPYLALCLTLAALAWALFSSSGMRELLALAVAFALLTAGANLILAGSTLIYCDPRRRWICALEGYVATGLLVFLFVALSSTIGAVAFPQQRLARS